MTADFTADILSTILYSTPYLLPYIVHFKKAPGLQQVLSENTKPYQLNYFVYKPRPDYTANIWTTLRP